MNTRRLIIVFLACLGSSLQAQNLKVKCDAYTNDGFANDITLTIVRMGEGEPNELEQVGKHKLLFGANEEYLLTYSKEGYVSKTIRLETPRQMKKSVTIEFDVLLMPQPSDDKTLVYSAPVGRIFFSGANNMKYETNYTYFIAEDFQDDIIAASNGE